MGGEPRWNGALFQARLAGEMALRICRQASQVKNHRQAGLIPAGQLGVKLANAADSLA